MHHHNTKPVQIPPDLTPAPHKHPNANIYAWTSSNYIMKPINYPTDFATLIMSRAPRPS